MSIDHIDRLHLFVCDTPLQSTSHNVMNVFQQMSSFEGCTKISSKLFPLLSVLLGSVYQLTGQLFACFGRGDEAQGAEEWTIGYVGFRGSHHSGVASDRCQKHVVT